MTKRAREYEDFRDKVFQLFQNPESTSQQKRDAMTALSNLYNSLGLEDYAAIRPMDTLRKNEGSK